MKFRRYCTYTDVRTMRSMVLCRYLAQAGRVDERFFSRAKLKAQGSSSDERSFLDEGRGWGWVLYGSVRRWQVHMFVGW